MGQTHNVLLWRSRKEIAALFTAECVRLTKVGIRGCTLVPFQPHATDWVESRHAQRIDQAIFPSRTGTALSGPP
jgi:hypothetical protein